MGLFDFIKKKGSDKTIESPIENKQDTNDEFTNDIIQAASFFVKSSSNRFSGLDYSVKSLETIEEALEEASDFYEDMDEDERQNLIKSVGSYIFEVARRNFGGKYFWYEQLKQPILVTGQPDFEASILAFEKVKGRLENGKEDNIPFYFKGYTERVESKTSGMIV